MGKSTEERLAVLEETAKVVAAVTDVQKEQGQDMAVLKNEVVHIIRSLDANTKTLDKVDKTLNRALDRGWGLKTAGVAAAGVFMTLGAVAWQVFKHLTGKL